jgi:hypothetical protein
MTAFMAVDSIGFDDPGAPRRFERPTPRDGALIRRLTTVMAIGFFLLAAYAALDRLFSKKFYNETGHAQWIWARHRVAANTPVVFFAVYDFILPAERTFTHVKILGDPEYALYFNSVDIGGRRVEERHTLDVYDVSPMSRTGRNRIVVAVRSANGVGGLIAAVDISPERENVVVTGSDWKIFRTWDPDLLVHDTPGLRVESPMLLGEPPMRRWNYLDRAPASVSARPIGYAPLRNSFSIQSAIPEFRTINGVVVAGMRREAARAYDFGPVVGWGKVTLRTGRRMAPEVVKVRYANDAGELKLLEVTPESFVVAPGESSVTDPQGRRFRYMLVYGCCNQASAEAIRSQ